MAEIFVLEERRSAPYEPGTRQETGVDRRSDSFIVWLRMVEGFFEKEVEMI